MERHEGVQPLGGAGLARKRAVELAQQLVDVVLDQIEQQFLLGGDVVVERSRLNADLGSQLAQAHRRVAVFEDQPQAGFADRLHRFGAV